MATEIQLDGMDMYCLSCITWATGECQRDHGLNLTEQVPISHFEEAFLPEMQRLADNMPGRLPGFDPDDEPSYIPVFDPCDDSAAMPSFDGVIDSDMELYVDDPGVTLTEASTSKLPDLTRNDNPDLSTRVPISPKTRGRSKSDPTTSPEEDSIKQAKIDSYVAEAYSVVTRMERFCHYVHHSYQITELWSKTLDDIRKFVAELQHDRNTRPAMVDTKVIVEWIKSLQDFELKLAAKIKEGIRSELEEVILDECCFECARWCAQQH